MLVYIILVTLFFLSFLSSIIYFTKLIGVKRQLKDMTNILVDIQSGNGSRRILASNSELTADLSYKINEIIYSYEEQLSKLKSADENNRQLMTSLSHDVRTPLTTLIGYLDAVHRGVITGKSQHDYIETARRKAHDLKEYIDVLFDWFKLNSSEFSLSVEQIELAELTRNILKDWIPIFEEKHLDYEIELPEKPLQAKVDCDGYSRIINNLIQNVITHSQATQIQIHMSKKEAEIQIVVQDNGSGIEKSHLKHIFERLYKCDTGRSNKGSGLGLSIVQQMTKKMNGKITVQSELNKYTIFTLLFPLCN